VNGRRPAISAEEITQAFQGAPGDRYPVILSPAQLAELLGLSVKTVYEWLAKDRLDGAYRKRGKHVLLWRDRAIDILLNGKDWSHD
jgi:excisionase family DNA binding protein